MPCNKSPGPDGFTVEFFKEAWQIIGNDFTVAVQSFFIFGFLPKGINSTILALILKKAEAKEMKDYRLISCCNVLYKVISKILANRLKTIIPEFIAPNQSAFIKDRLLMENLLLASELVKDYHKESVSPRCAMKIDISKAFDSVQWSFLRNTLSALNIPEKFIHWIDLCVTTPSFSVQVNGELAGFFRNSRGLRQGCSLSPYPFVICMNILSLKLDKAASEGQFGYHPKCRGLKLTHLCFADDIMVFADGKIRSTEGILAVFNEFARISGLQISLEKSTLFMAGVSQSNLDAILSRFPFELGALPVRYLGLPLLTKRMSQADFLPLIEKIRSRISSWKNRCLLYAGRLQLLNSVIASLTNFWISAFRLPSACIKEIEKLCSAFLWSGPELNPRKTKISWVHVCRQKQEGGLGIKSIAEANKVSCFKMIWRIVAGKNSLWVCWIQRHLIRTGSFWSVKESSSLGSWMWRKLLKYRAQAKMFHKVDVRSGSQTSFWYDNWSVLGRLHEAIGNRGFIDLGISPSASVADAIATHRRRRHRLDLLNKIEKELDKLRSHLPCSEPDIALWRCGEDKFKDVFSSKSTFSQVRSVMPQWNWHRGLWFPSATPKYTFITWLAAHDRLTTGEKMMSWNSGASSSCVFCQHPMETRDHLFFECSFSSYIWERLTRGILQRRYLLLFEDILDLISGSTFSGTLCFLLRYALQASVHTIWCERNQRRHGEPPTTSALLLKAIDWIIRNRLLSLKNTNSSKLQDGLQLWFNTRN